MSRSGYDRYISIFSPEGKLYQVEYAHKAVKNCGITAIAIRGKTCALVVSQKKVPDKLILESSVTSLYRIASDIGMCVTGRPADCLPVVTLARREAAEYTHRTGEACPVSYLAQKMADKAQFGTQNAGVRLLGVSLHFFSLELMDDGTHAPRIYRVDPSGYCISYYASAAGAKDSEALHFLEKRQKEQSFQQFDTLDRVATLGLSCLQTILNEEIKARDVEVGFVRLQEHQPHAAVQYEVASAEMIEAWLTQIAERD